MTIAELVIVLAWVLLPPVAVALCVLVLLHRRNAWHSRWRTAGAAVLPVVASALASVALVLFGPPGFGSLIGIRDQPVMWAPFAFIAVAATLPLVIWWASRRPRTER